MKFKKSSDALFLIIPSTALVALLLARFTEVGKWVKMEDVIIFMLCGLSGLTGFRQLKNNRSIGLFLVSASLAILLIRLMLVINH